MAFLAPGVLRHAAAIDARFAELGLGLVDASLMAYAERHDLPVLTFDFAHFRAAPPKHGYWRLVVDEAKVRQHGRLRPGDLGGRADQRLLGRGAPRELAERRLVELALDRLGSASVSICTRRGMDARGDVAVGAYLVQAEQAIAAVDRAPDVAQGGRVVAGGGLPAAVDARAAGHEAGIAQAPEHAARVDRARAGARGELLRAQALARPRGEQREHVDGERELGIRGTGDGN